jgi:hypothetical protein
LTSINGEPLPAPGAACNIRRDIMTRSLRRAVARCAIVALAFSQLVAAAHACGIGRQSVAGHHPVGVVGTAHTGDHCGGHATTTTATAPPANVCQAHCSDGAMRTSTPNLPAMAAMPVLIAATTLALPFGPESQPVIPIVTPGGAPPPMLQFCRLLI